MIHQLFTFELWIISNFLTSSLLTFSVIYTFDFYIASEELKIYQNNLIKKYLTFFYLRNLFMTTTWAILFFRGFSFLLLLFEGSKLVSQATWRNEYNPVVLTQSKIQPLTGKIRSVVLNRFPFSEAKHFQRDSFISRKHTESQACASRSPGSGPDCTWHATPENGNCEHNFKNAHTYRVVFFTAPP